MSLQHKIDKVKEVLLNIKTEEDKEKAKEELKKILGTVTPVEIGIIEQELIRQGVSPYTIAELCNAHVEIFKDFLIQDKSLLELPPGHPLHTLMEESNIALREAEKLTIYSSILRQRKFLGEEEKKNLQRILIGLFGLRNHFGKLQMLVFPYLERRGLTAIPRVLWIRQDRLIARIKLVLNKLNEDKLTPELLDELARDIIDMVERENKILYPLLNGLLSLEEWYAIKLEENIGHYGIEPQLWDPGVDPSIHSC